MKSTKIKFSDACEAAFDGFKLDVTDDSAWWFEGDEGEANREATCAILEWAGWRVEGGEIVEVSPYHARLMVPADANAEVIVRAAGLLTEAGDVEGGYAEERDGDERRYALQASRALCALGRKLLDVGQRRAQRQEKRNLAKCPRVVWTHFLGRTVTYRVKGWRVCECGAKVAELVGDYNRADAERRCVRTGGLVGVEHGGVLYLAKPCDADPDADWVALLAGVVR